MATAMLRTIGVRLAANTASFRSSMKGAENTLDKFSRKVSRFQRKHAGGFAGFLTGAMVADFGRRTVQMADAMQNLRNKMGAVYDSSADVAQGMLDVKRISMASRSEIDSVGTLYQRMALSTKDLGVEQEKIARLTEVVANSFVISGTTGSEAANSARQLAQGLASGALRGDEFRSVSENNVYLTQALASGLNMTIGELREFSKEGGITTEVMLDLLASKEKVLETQEAIGKMTVTLGQSFTLFSNKVSMVADAINQRFKVLPKMAGFVKALSDNLHILAFGITVLVVPALVAFAVKGLVGVIAYSATTIIQIGIMATRFAVLGAAALTATIKVTALPLAIIAVGAAIAMLVNGIKNNAEEIGKGFKLIATAGEMWFDYLKTTVAARFTQMILNVKLMLKSFANWIQEKTGVTVFKFDTENDQAQLNSVEAMIKEAKRLQDEGNSLFTDGALLVASSIGEGFMESMQATGEGIKSFFGTVLADIQAIPEAILESSPALREFMELLKGNSQQDEQAAAAGGGDGEGTKSVWDQFKDLSWTEKLQGALKGIKATAADVFGSMETKVKALYEGMQSWSDVLGHFATKSKKVAILRSVIALKEAMIQGQAAIMKAWNSSAFPANLPAVALTTAKVAAVVSQIKGTMGQFHDGIDNVPKTGTYLLEQGERVVDKRLNADLKSFMSQGGGGGEQQPITLNVNGVSDPDLVVEALSYRRGELESLIRQITADNLGRPV